MAQRKKPRKSASAPAGSTSERRRPTGDRGRRPRTAGGKKADPEVMAAAAIESQEGLRERTEAGHRAAGRTPPSERTSARSAGAARVVDDAIRSADAEVTEDEKL